MEWEQIRKRPEERAGANLLDYEEYARTFSWTQARALLDGLPGGGLNIAHEAVDRHLQAGRGDRLALRWIGRDDRIRDFTYSALAAATNRFANVITQRGVTRADEIFRYWAGYRNSTSQLSAPSRMGAYFRPCSRRSGRSRSRPA